MFEIKAKTVVSLFIEIMPLLVPLIIACIALIVMTRKLSIRCVRFSPSRLIADDDGAAYSLSLVLALPFYMLVLAVIAECALMLVVKLGTFHAAYVTTRSAIVWQGSDAEPQQKQQKIHLAAVQAITPFASSRELNVQPTNPLTSAGSETAGNLVAAYQNYSGGQMSAGYFRRKMRYAFAATKVTIVQHDNINGRDYTQDITVTVTYEKPIDLPVVGRFLGQRASMPGAGFFTRKIETTLKLEKEGPKSATRTLGINYDSWNY